MKNLELLHLPKAEALTLQKRINKLAAIAGIKIDILGLQDNFISVRVEQIDLKNGWILNQDELSYRAKEIFRMYPKLKIHYFPLTYQPKFETITKEWIKAKMKEFNLKQVDICKHLGLDKSTLSSLLNDENKTVTRFQKSAFYFYFLNFELNKNFREHMKAMEEEMEKRPVGDQSPLQNFVKYVAGGNKIDRELVKSRIKSQMQEYSIDVYELQEEPSYARMGVKLNIGARSGSSNVSEIFIGKQGFKSGGIVEHGKRAVRDHSED